MSRNSSRTLASLALLLSVAFFGSSVGCKRAPSPRRDGRQQQHQGKENRSTSDHGKASPGKGSTPKQHPRSTPQAAPSSPPVVPLTSAGKLEDERNTISVFRALAPATVFVTQNRVVRDWHVRPLEVPAGSGSGFVWNDQGFIVTNFHVIDPGNRGPVTYTVTLYNQKTYRAKLVGGEPTRDVAVLKIDVPKDEIRPVVLLPKGETLQVGQKALAIGNPFGLDHTLTVGVVSALGREVKGYGGVTIRGMIQTDASINPGNSGGPLLDSKGRLIGMNTMIMSKSGSSAGIGFAVPVSIIRRIVPQIIQYGHAKRAGLGIRLLPDVYARRVGIRGVIVAEVAPGSPAEKMGLQGLRRTPLGAVIIGDVIVGIDDTPVKNYDDLFNALDKYEAGQEVTVHFRRGDKLLSAKTKLVNIN